MITTFPLHICSLEAIREADISLYDGIITIEDSNIKNPFRVDYGGPEQLILTFDDISKSTEEFVEPQIVHIERALLFADKIGNGSLLVHCHAGISRSSAIALAIIAKKLGAGKEDEAVKTLEFINPNCRPNKALVFMSDEILDLKGKLIESVMNSVPVTN